jgi:hypothetical protein
MGLFGNDQEQDARLDAIDDLDAQLDEVEQQRDG